MAQSASAGETQQRTERACPTLTVSDGWYGDNKARLQKLVDAHCGDRRDAKGDKPVAVFDWDNTVIKNDAGDATMFWILRNGRIRTP